MDPRHGQLTPRQPPWLRSPVVVVLIMMAGVSLIHAIAGGYSAQSRHQYVPLAMLVLLVAAIFRRGSKLEALLRWRNSLVLVLASAVAVATTWLVTSINRFELRSYTAVCEYLSSARGNKIVTIRYDPPIYYLWPQHPQIVGSHAYDVEWVLNESIVSGSGSSPVTLVDSGGQVVIVRRSVVDPDRITVSGHGGSPINATPDSRAADGRQDTEQGMDGLPGRK